MTIQSPHEYDFRKAVSNNRLKGLWRMMSGFQWHYTAATSSLAVAACAKTATFLLLRDTAAGDINPNYTVMFFYKGQAGYTWVVDDEATLETTLNAAVQGRDVVHVVRW